MLLETITALAAKVAGANTVAQVAAGLGITVAGVTGAGAVGALPGPVQDGVAGVIESVTPFNAPDSADGPGAAPTSVVPAPVRDVATIVSPVAPAPVDPPAAPSAGADDGAQGDGQHDDGQHDDGQHGNQSGGDASGGSGHGGDEGSGHGGGDS